MLQKLCRLWIMLTVISGGIALAFLGLFLSQLWKFINLNAEAPALVSKLNIKELSPSRFAIEAYYSYEIDGTLYKGKTLFEKKTFLNHFIAETHKEVLEKKSWRVWYVKRNPSLSSLEKEAPYKGCLQALLTVGVFIYFYFAKDLLVKFIASTRG